MEYIRLARLIATGAHCGQVDKGGNPYIEHPKTVAFLVSTKEEKIVAWLHDVVEDTDVTLSDLLTLFDYKTVKAVEAITRKDGEDRKAYLARVKANPIATRVKIADLTHNSDLSRIKRPLTDEDIERRRRYQEEIEYLRGEYYGRKEDQSSII